MAFFRVAFACVACTAPSQPLTSVAVRNCEETDGGEGGAIFFPVSGSQCGSGAVSTLFQKMPVERPGSSGERRPHTAAVE